MIYQLIVALQKFCGGLFVQQLVLRYGKTITQKCMGEICLKNGTKSVATRMLVDTNKKFHYDVHTSLPDLRSAENPPLSVKFFLADFHFYRSPLLLDRFGYFLVF